jgi:hypothetical protein
MLSTLTSINGMAIAALEEFDFPRFDISGADTARMAISGFVDYCR